MNMSRSLMFIGVLVFSMVKFFFFVKSFVCINLTEDSK